MSEDVPVSEDALFREIRLRLSRDDALELCILLDGVSPLANFSGYYEILYEDRLELSRRHGKDGEAGKDGERPGETTTEKPEDWTELALYFSEPAPESALHLELLLAARRIGEFELREKVLERVDYLEAYKRYYRPFLISPRLAIIPSWLKDDDQAKALLGPGVSPLYLDPGMAFGTGLHPTTRLCLRRLDEMLEPGLALADAGCGSGILSIGAALLGASEILAFDVDGTAVRGASSNLALNPGIAGRIRVCKGGFDLPEFASFSCDLLIANITENVLIANRSWIENSSCSRLLQSGVLTEQRPGVEEAFGDSWELIHADEEDGWALLDWKRK